jgi:hypothetical protein
MTPPDKRTGVLVIEIHLLLNSSAQAGTRKQEGI